MTSKVYIIYFLFGMLSLYNTGDCNYCAVYGYSSIILYCIRMCISLQSRNDKSGMTRNILYFNDIQIYNIKLE